MNSIPLHSEQIPDDEGDTIADMVNQTIAGMKLINGCQHRAQHAKATACLRARFRIMENIPQTLRYGIFSQPGVVYEAILRFSNSTGDPSPEGGFQKDGIGTARGLAIKILIEEREQNREKVAHQDFLLMSNPIFPFPDPKAYLSTIRLKNLPLIGNVLAAAQLAILERDELEILQEIRAKQVGNPLAIKYWSGTPYWLGSADKKTGQAVKYVVSHHQPFSKPVNDPSTLDNDYLTTSAFDFLATNEATFTFKVQVQTDATAMPIENASVKWDEDESDPIPVAQLTIASQSRDPDFEASMERLAFNPWHALPEHRPMGGLNRLRKAVYEASSTRRVGACPALDD